MDGKYKIVDEESDHFGKVGTYEDTAVFNGRLLMYYIKFDDEELPYGFLAHQVEKYIEPTLVVVRSWKASQKFTCSECGKGKYQAEKPINFCPKCNHPHIVKVQM